MPRTPLHGRCRTARLDVDVGGVDAGHGRRKNIAMSAQTGVRRSKQLSRKSVASWLAEHMPRLRQARKGLVRLYDKGPSRQASLAGSGQLCVPFAIACAYGSLIRIDSVRALG